MRKILIVAIFLLSVKSAGSQTFKELNDSLIYYYQSKSFDEAIPFAEKLVVFVQNNYGDGNKIYHTYLNMLASLYLQKGYLKKTEDVLIRANKVIQKLNGDNSEELIKGYSLLAVVYNGLGQDDKAIPLLKKAMEYYRSVKGESDPDYAASLNKLAKAYESFGLYNEAEPLFVAATAIRKKANGLESLEYATTINNLGLLYKNMGRPDKAEPLLLTAMQIRKKGAGEKSTDFANSLNNVAVFYTAIGQNEKAEDYYKKAASIYKTQNGRNSSEYITCLTNIGELYSAMFRYEEAEKVLLEAAIITKENLKENAAVNESISRNLGQLYLSMNEFSKAEPFLLEVINIEKTQSEKSITYANSLNDIAFLYNHSNRISAAEDMYKRAAEIIKLNYGEKHPDYASAISNLSELYHKQDRFSEAISLISEVNKLKIGQLHSLFSILSESEKLTYMTSNFYLLQSNLSLLASYKNAPPSFYREIFDLLLLVKSMLLTDSKNLLESVRNNNDSIVKKVYEEWKTNKSVLSKEYSLPVDLRRQDLKPLEEETELLEKKLITVSAAVRRLQDKVRIRTADVYNRLKNAEAAIEFVKFPNKEHNDSVTYGYGAFLLTRKDSVPKFIPLCNESELQQLFDSVGKSSTARVKNFYRGLDLGNAGSMSSGTRLYNMIWAPLEPFLNDVKKIFYSPTDRLYSIAFHALPVDSGNLLIDKYNLQQYTSIRNLVLSDTLFATAKPTDVVLFGNADFSMDSIAIANQRMEKMDTAALSKHIYAPQKSEIMTGAWASLPGTAEELEKISSLFKKNRNVSRLFTKQQASEENLKALGNHSPQVLHIATHGFFLKQKNRNPSLVKENIYTITQDPLLRSGLILAGGNYAWGGKTPIKGAEDGIVTAYEIAQLNLSNTQLVVLSACETGLGDVKGSEGVFGLQRAFKLAGVGKMIVSLWQVPDKETAELMTSFYSYWLKGKTIEESFVQAQADMRKKYPPFYWAAFILIE